MTNHSSNKPKKIAYVLKGFPRLSETFISNEVRLLTGLGLDLRPFSIKAGDKLAERNGLPPVTYLPVVSGMSQVSLRDWMVENWSKFSTSQRYWFTHDPVRYLKTLTFALTCSWRYRRGYRIKKTFIKEFLLATDIARRMQEQGGYVHIHAHFCHDATTIAWMTSKLIDLPFSFTAHAKDIYQKSLNPGDLLERKLAATQFATTCTMANVAYLTTKTEKPANIYGIYHGLDTNRFRPTPRKSRKSDDSIRLISVGRHVEKKGFSYLLESCRLLQIRGIRFRLDIVGEQGDQTQKLSDYIAKFELKDSVFLNPPIAQIELPKLYNTADIFVLPCIIVSDGDRDGIPNVMAEAMACALPVVVSDVSGIPEIVEHEFNGLLVQQKDAYSLAQAIERLANDDALRFRISGNARRTIESRFNADKTHDFLHEIFTKALSESHASV
ncbi:MAG: glycosyltransferase family 4 protein [Burkholderiaceae bacterium]